MKLENPIETIVGAGVIGVAIAFAIYAGGDERIASATSKDYELVAKFRSAAGLSPGTDVRIAGVKVGRVASLDLDPKTFRAAVTLSIRSDIELSDETIAKIDSEGILGGSFVAIEPVPGFEALRPGDEIVNTQGSVSLLDLLAQFASAPAGDQK